MTPLKTPFEEKIRNKKGFHAVVPKFEDLSMHVLFTTVGLILSKGNQKLFSTSQIRAGQYLNTLY